MKDDTTLKPYCQQLSTALQRNNPGFEQEKCEVVAYAIVRAVCDSYGDEYREILNDGVDVDLAAHGCDELDNLELMLDAETTLFTGDVDVSEDFLRGDDCNVGNTLLKISECLYREAFKNN